MGKSGGLLVDLCQSEQSERSCCWERRGRTKESWGELFMVALMQQITGLRPLKCPHLSEACPPATRGTRACTVQNSDLALCCLSLLLGCQQTVTLAVRSPFPRSLKKTGEQVIVPLLLHLLTLCRSFVELDHHLFSVTLHLPSIKHW